MQSVTSETTNMPTFRRGLSDFTVEILIKNLWIYKLGLDVVAEVAPDALTRETPGLVAFSLYQGYREFEKGFKLVAGPHIKRLCHLSEIDLYGFEEVPMAPELDKTEHQRIIREAVGVATDKIKVFRQKWYDENPFQPWLSLDHFFDEFKNDDGTPDDQGGVMEGVLLYFPFFFYVNDDEAVLRLMQRLYAVPPPIQDPGTPVPRRLRTYAELYGIFNSETHVDPSTEHFRNLPRQLLQNSPEFRLLLWATAWAGNTLRDRAHRRLSSIKDIAGGRQKRSRSE